MTTTEPKTLHEALDTMAEYIAQRYAITKETMPDRPLDPKGATVAEMAELILPALTPFVGILHKGRLPPQAAVDAVTTAVGALWMELSEIHGHTGER